MTVTVKNKTKKDYRLRKDANPPQKTQQNLQILRVHIRDRLGKTKHDKQKGFIHFSVPFSVFLQAKSVITPSLEDLVSFATLSAFIQPQRGSNQVHMLLEIPKV